MVSKNKFNDKSPEELRIAYSDLCKDIFRINSEAKMTRQLDKPHRLRMLKKDRARVLTALRSKNATLNERG